MMTLSCATRFCGRAHNVDILVRFATSMPAKEGILICRAFTPSKILSSPFGVFSHSERLAYDFVPITRALCSKPLCMCSQDCFVLDREVPRETTIPRIGRLQNIPDYLSVRC